MQRFDARFGVDTGHGPSIVLLTDVALPANTMATSRSFGATSLTTRPPIRTFPLVTSSRPGVVDDRGHATDVAMRGR
jgi:hypothetical protein